MHGIYSCQFKDKQNKTKPWSISVDFLIYLNHYFKLSQYSIKQLKHCNLQDYVIISPGKHSIILYKTERGGRERECSTRKKSH